MKPELEKIVKKMCEMVGADFGKTNFKTDYFLEYTWTPEQEQEFEVWLSNELYNNKKLFQELSNFPYKSKQRCSKMAKEFTLNHGWKYEEVT